MNQAAIIFGLIITAVISVGAFQTLLPNVNKVENESMETELMNIVNAAVSFRNTNRSKDTFPTFSSTLEPLSKNGYLDSNLYSDGDGESVINTDISANVKAPGTASTVKYNAGDEESCNYIKQRVDAGRIPNLDQDDTKHTCNDADLTVTLKD